MFKVENLDELLSRLTKHGAEIVGEVVNYEHIYRLCYIRGTDAVAKITKASGEINYEAEVNKKDVVFDTRGKFLKKEADED